MGGNSFRDYQRRTEARRLGRPDPVQRDGHEADSEGELHHITVVGHPDATRELPRWIVEHYDTGDTENPSAEHHFSDGVEMLTHIGRHANVPGFEEENSKEVKGAEKNGR